MTDIKQALQTARERVFARFVNKIEFGEHWLWKGCLTQGYGRFGRAFAHRWSYEHFVGPIPFGLQIDHLCRVRNCVNPDHLEPVSGRENTLRGETIPATNSRKTHCLRGHPYDEKNTYFEPAGKRSCRTCRAMQSRGAYWSDPDFHRGRRRRSKQAEVDRLIAAMQKEGA